MDYKVSVVIPVYGQWHLVKRNIDALLSYDRMHIAEIIAVDDCSPESNPFTFDADIVTVIKNTQNKGYAGTVNNGLRKASSDIIVLLDSDAYPIGPFISKVISAFTENERLGCIGFATVDDDGKPVNNYRYEPSAAGLLAGQQLEVKLGLLKDTTKNIMPYSCAVAFRKQCLEEMDYLDDTNFPVLDADHDISMRIHRSDWKLEYRPDIIVSHKGGNSYQINHKRVLLYYNSRWRLLQKHGLLKAPAFQRTVIKSRLFTEWMLLKILTILRPGKKSYREKMEGRRIILKSVSLN